MEPLFDRLILSHGDDLFIEKSLIESCIDVCEKVMTGKDDAVPFEFLGSPGWIAMKTDENNKRLDGGLGNIVYHKDKIRNPGQADGRRVSP